MTERAKVKLLPINVANKIAAGEVIERPASALKELVENSLDAGATQIDISVCEGGRKLILVKDNGCGMCREDALLSLERQATSKIRDVDDIERISTLGFRGEAIPSIASVSRFTLVTRTEEDEAATRLKVEAGRLAEVAEAGAPKGTLVEVRDLFCNVPARKKFLRAVATEETHVKALFTQHALAHPDVGFTLQIDGRKVYELARGDTLKERIQALFGADFADACVEIGQDGAEASGVKVTGFVERPSVRHATRREQFVFVNGRPATAAPIAYALKESLSKGSDETRPGVILFIELAPTLVDVNVHPAKREVRFRRPGDVREAIMGAIGKALSPVAAQEPFMPPFQGRPAPQPFMPIVDEREDAPGPEPAAVAPEMQPTAPVQGELPIEEPAGANLPFKLDSISNILPLSTGFAIMETSNGIIVLNPKAAIERISYEKAMKLSSGAVSQPLIIPETVRLAPADSARLASFKGPLEEIGFRIDNLGMDTWKVDAVPQMMAKADAGAALASIAADMADAGVRRGAARWREDLTARAVAKACARASKALHADGILKLVKELASCDMPYVTPRGKPVLIFTSRRELDRRFGM